MVITARNGYKEGQIVEGGNWYNRLVVCDRCHWWYMRTYEFIWDIPHEFEEIAFGIGPQQPVSANDANGLQPWLKAPLWEISILDCKYPSTALPDEIKKLFT